MDVEQVLAKLNTAPPQKKPLQQFFVTGNQAYLVYQLASRISHAQAPMPTKFSLNYVSGTASVLVFGTSQSFADKCVELVPEGATGVLALDVTYYNCLGFSKNWVKSLQSKNIEFAIFAFNVTSDQTLTRATECLLRAVALQARAGFARAYYASEIVDVAQAIMSREALNDYRKVPYFIPPGKDTCSYILQNARSTEEIIDKMTEKLGSQTREAEERIFSSVEEYIKWVDYVGKCGADLAEIVAR